MSILESTPGNGRFSAFGSTIARNDASAFNDPCVPGGTAQLSLGMVLGTMHIHLTHLTRVRGWAKS
jgi:hypothetical protein